MTPARKNQSNELRYFIALKRILRYDKVEWLKKNGPTAYGVTPEEAVEAAYENIISEARVALFRKRRPKS